MAKKQIPEGLNPRAHGGQKHDGVKSRVELLDAHFTLAEGYVAAYGALKYADENWRKFDDPMPFFAAAERHLLLARLGESVNHDDTEEYHRLLAERGHTAKPELYHLAQAAWNCRAAWWVIERKLSGEWVSPSDLAEDFESK